ncbi:MAG TPA: hypothetical protein VJ044_09830, partial [Candidatus Hodarchaeales archaeon]|nr:hypothetical protein [Candidatus Hodarchaeales archaeon]
IYGLSAWKVKTKRPAQSQCLFSRARVGGCLSLFSLAQQLQTVCSWLRNVRLGSAIHEGVTGNNSRV